MKTRKEKAPKIIGRESVYIGHERRYGGYGTKILVTAIFRYQEDEDSDDRHVMDNERLAELGGLSPFDGAEIHSRHPTENRWCFVGDELESILDIEAFSELWHFDDDDSGPILDETKYAALAED